MVSRDELISIEEASRLLDISVQHVRRLADSGALTKVARGVIDRNSLDQHLSSQRRGRTRAWAEQTAWGAIALLAGSDADWLGASQTSRVRRTLRELNEPSDLLVRLRDRATTRTYTAHRAALPRLREIIAVSDLVPLGIVDGDRSSVDGYIAAGALEATVRDLALQQTATGNVTLRATTFNFVRVQNLIAESTVVAALDAATSVDPRIRGVGERSLANALKAYT